MATETVSTPRKRVNLKPEQRAAAVAFLLGTSVQLEVPCGAIAECALKFGCSDNQISWLWKRAVQDIKAGWPINYDSGKKGKSGRKTRLTDEFREDLKHAIELVPLEERTNTRSLSRKLGIPKSTLHAYCSDRALHTTREFHSAAEVEADKDNRGPSANIRGHLSFRSSL